MNKKVVLSVLSTAVVASMATSAFAKVNDGLYLGGNVKKYYSTQTLFDMNDSARAQFNSYIAQLSSDFNQIVYVNQEGKGASIQEILNEGLATAIAEPLAATDFADSYSQIGNDGSVVATVDPQDELGGTPAELKVESVSAINATQVQVVFGVKVNKTAAETEANYEIDGVNPASAVLGEDGKTVTLTFANASEVEVTNGVLIVEPITTADDADKQTAKYTQVLTYEDTVKPTITKVEAKTNGTVATSVTVTASEPIASSLAKIDGTYYTINFAGTNTATISGLALDATKSHTLEVINLTDKGGNVTVQESKTFSVSVDAVAPNVTLSAKSDKEILLTFDKPMDVSTVAAAFAANVGVKDESLANVNHTAVTAAVADTNDTQFIIPITDTLYGSKTSRTFTVVLPDTIKDKLGNKITAANKTVTLTKDVTKPAVTGYKVVKDSQGRVTDIEVNFSEGLAANANPAEPTIVNENGVDVTATFLGGLTADPITAGDTKVTYSVGAAAKVSGKFAFSFPANLVSDRAETANNSDAFNQTIDFGSAATAFDLPSAPTSAANVITVEFGRAVKGGAVANSATDLANYTLGGKPLPAGTSIVLDAAQDTATITLPADSVATTDSNAVFTVANIKSLNGELLNTYTGTISVVDNTKPVLTSAVLNTDGTLTIGFSETLAVDVASGDLAVKVNGVAVTTADVAVANGVGADAGKYVLTVKQQFDALGDGDATNDVLFLDADGDDAYDAGEVVLTTGAANGAVVGSDNTAVNLKNALPVTSITVGTVASPATGKDAANNILKGSVVITVK